MVVPCLLTGTNARPSLLRTACALLERTLNTRALAPFGVVHDALGNACKACAHAARLTSRRGRGLLETGSCANTRTLDPLALHVSPRWRAAPVRCFAVLFPAPIPPAVAGSTEGEGSGSPVVLQLCCASLTSAPSVSSSVSFGFSYLCDNYANMNCSFHSRS